MKTINILPPKNANASPEERCHELAKIIHPHEADLIVDLEFKTQPTDKEDRLLELMYHHSTRRCAEVIVNVEYNLNRYHSSENQNIRKIDEFLLNDSILEEVRFFIAIQLRNHLKELNFDYFFDTKDEALWYPDHYNKTSYVAYLKAKSQKTIHEMQLLELLSHEHESFMDIMILSCLRNPTEFDKKYLELLQDGMPCVFAKKIAKLECTSSLTPEEQDHLKYLRDPKTRVAVKDILFVKYNKIETFEDDLHLLCAEDPRFREQINKSTLLIEKESKLYIKVVLEQQTTPKKQLETSLDEQWNSEEQFDLKQYFLRRIIPSYTSHHSNPMVVSPLAALSILSNRDHLSSHLASSLPHSDTSNLDKYFKDNQDIILGIIDTYCHEIIKFYIKRAVKRDDRLSTDWTNYNQINQRRLSFLIVQYFFKIQSKFSEAMLIDIVNQLKEKINQCILQPYQGMSLSKIVQAELIGLHGKSLMQQLNGEYNTSAQSCMQSMS